MKLQKRPEIVHPDSLNYVWVMKAMGKQFIGRNCREKGCSPDSFEYCLDGSPSWFRKDKRQPSSCGNLYCHDVKEKMTKMGFAYPNDAMYWSMKILESEYISRAISSRFPEIIIDEAQDTSKVQIEIIKALHRSGANIILVGDPDQSIFEFNGARPDLFKKLQENWDTLSLSNNFRSSQLICNATSIFSCELSEPVTAMGVVKDYPLKPLIIKYKDENIEKLLAAYRALLQRYEIAEADSLFSLGKMIQ